MFQKIAKHRANDASNDVHRPPLEGGEGGWLCKHTQLLMPTLDTAAPQKYARPSVWRDTDPFYLECIPTLK